MDDRTHNRLKYLFESLCFESEHSFIFGGSSFSVGTAQDMVNTLTQCLYQHCYTVCFEGNLAAGPAVAPADNPSFMKKLSEANNCTVFWDTDWVVDMVLPEGSVIASKDGRRRSVPISEFAVQDALGMSVQNGARIAIFHPRESMRMQYGFYFIFGDAVIDGGDKRDISRIYWNISSEGAALLVQNVTRRLNRFEVPFRMKTLSIPTLYTRIDSAVVFVPRRYLRIASEICRDVYEAVKSHLQNDVPLFCLKIGQGVGVADDPGTGDSFGTHRCRLVAQACFDLYRSSGTQSISERFSAVAHHFLANGCNLDQPYSEVNSGLETHVFSYD